ncbi:MAG: hypothetical protein IT538_12375 [Variibacter sp.]|nr:hypothetical protein [Variibacter sp.]
MAERPDNNILNMETMRDPARNNDANSAQRSGQAIVSLLQQAADVAKRNEERAKAQALHLAEELRASEERCRQMEARLRHFETRAAEAENWLLRIYDEIQDRLIEPLTGEAPHERVARR